MGDGPTLSGPPLLREICFAFPLRLAKKMSWKFCDMKKLCFPGFVVGEEKDRRPRRHREAQHTHAHTHSRTQTGAAPSPDPFLAWVMGLSYWSPGGSVVMDGQHGPGLALGQQDT